jgi:hypothetical protein
MYEKDRTQNERLDSGVVYPGLCPGWNCQSYVSLENLNK